MQLPACHPSEPDFGADVPLTADVPTPRCLYRSLLRLEENPHYLLPAYRFAQAALGDVSSAPSLMSAMAGGVPDIIAAASNDHPLHPMPARPVPRRRLAQAVRELAPYALIDGCWLQGVVGLPTTETRSGALLFKQFMERVGIGRNRTLFAERFRSLLRALDSPDWQADDEGFSTSPRVSDASFEFALLPLTVGLFPQTFFPEIAGLNLWFACLGPSPLLGALQCELKDLGVDAGYFNRSTCDLAPLAARTVAELWADAADRASVAERVARGYAASSSAARRWERAVFRDVLGLHPRDEMLRLIGSKARYAAGYHAGVRLGGEYLDEYFRGGPEGHASLLDALSASKFIVPGSPESSPLLSEVSAFGGPMFEIFNAEEKQVISDWICSLTVPARPDGAGIPVQLLFGRYTPPQDANLFERQSIARFESVPAAEQAYYLLNIDLFPIARPFSRRLATQARDERFGICSLHPMHDRRPARRRDMHGFMEGLHREQRAAYDPSQGRTVSREIVLSSNLSAAASMLIDGCWLQGFADIARIGHDEYRLLFTIYASELGDGDLDWNHNVLSRRLLVSMGFELPATHEPAFFRARRGEIRHEAGVSNLAMAINHRMMLPELLGINLATEAWGVGDNFRQAADQLRALGFDPTISVLHNSIDNFSTGHTRQSIQAIDSAIDRVARIDPKLADHWWERIWIAFFGHRVLIEMGDARRLKVVDEARQQAHAARLSLERGELDRAEACLRGIVSGAEPGDDDQLLRGWHANAWRLLGVIALQRSDAHSSIEHVERSLRIRPDRTDASLDLGFALLASGRREQALDVLERAHALAPDDASVLCARGNALRELDRTAEALTSYDASLAREPRFAPAHFNRGEVLRRLGRSQEALQSYERALALGCPGQHAHAGRAQALLDLRRPDEALGACDRALELSPESASLCELRTLILRNERLRQAPSA